MGTDHGDVRTARHGLKHCQRVAETDQQIDTDQRLNAGGKRIADRQLFDLQSLLFEKSRVYPNVGDSGADFPTRIGQAQLLRGLRGGAYTGCEYYDRERKQQDQISAAKQRV